MTEHNCAVDKSIVLELEFGKNTAKRVYWESWEFTVEGPHLVRVTNASYGFQKHDHSYLVGVEDRDVVLVPAECECPADMYNDDSDCKHKVALATVGGKAVLKAAVEFDPTPSTPEGNSNVGQLTPDGGTESAPASCKNGSGRCGGPSSADLPCFDCFAKTGCD